MTMRSHDLLRGACALSALFLLACPSDDGGEQEVGEEAEAGADTESSSEGGPESLPCSARLTEEDCDLPGQSEDESCAWAKGQAVTMVGDSCEFGEAIGFCVLGGRGDDTCGAAGGYYYAEVDGMFSLVEVSPCDSVGMGYMSCEDAGDMAPQVCACGPQLP